jgi:uncharacterized membrane protein YphA (DoxX/SURF4 family)
VFVVTLLLSLVLAAVFAAAGTFKIVKNPTSADTAEHLGFSLRSWRIIGWLEILGAIGLLVGLYYARIGEAAALGLVLLMLGAVIIHIRVRDTFKVMSAPLTLGVVAAVTLLLRVQTV